MVLAWLDSLTCWGTAVTACTSYGFGAAYDMSKFSTFCCATLVRDVLGLGGVYGSWGAGCGTACWRCGVVLLDTGVPFCGDASGTGLRVGVSAWWLVRCCSGTRSFGCWCRGEPNSLGPARRPRSPRCSGVLVGDGDAPVGSEGSGRRFTGMLCRGPPTVGLCPSGRVGSFFFSTTGLSRVS
jgi:hypothetical protein